MFDWLKRFFGEGKIRVEFKGIDRQGKMRNGTAKVPYIGMYNEDDVLIHIRRSLLVEHGIVVTKLKVVGRVQP